MRRLIALLLVGSLLTLGFGCGESAPTIPDTPDGTMKALTEGMANNKPEVAWAMLPPSYQKDVKGLISLFAEKMDPEIFQKGVKVANQAVGVLRDKKEFILKHPMVKMMLMKVDTEKASKNWGEVVGMAELVLNSKLSRLDNLKDLDVGAFLRGTGAEFMQKMDTVAALQEDNEYEKEFKGAMKGMKVKLISSEGDKAVVEVTPMGKRPKKETFVRVEGKWLPEEMQKDWKGMMEDGRKQIETMAQELTGENKQKFMETMSKAEEVLGKLAAAKDAKAFNMAFGAMMRDVMGDMMPGMMGGGMPGGDMR